MRVYEDCITYSITTDSPFPIWNLMEDSGEIIGCAGLISNDFISRMDLWPWICALYIDNSYRGRSLGKELLLLAKADAEKAGFNKVFLCTDHIGYYEKYGFTYIGDGYHLGEAVQEFMRAITKIIILQVSDFLFNNRFS